MITIHQPNSEWSERETQSAMIDEMKEETQAPKEQAPTTPEDGEVEVFNSLTLALVAIALILTIIIVGFFSALGDVIPVMDESERVREQEKRDLR